MRIKLIFVGVLALAAAGSLYVWGVPRPLLDYLSPAAAPPAAEASRGPVPVVAAVVSAEDVPIYLSGIGTVQAYNTVGDQEPGRRRDHPDPVPGRPGREGRRSARDHRSAPVRGPAASSRRAARAKDAGAAARARSLDLKRYEDLVMQELRDRQQVDQQQALVDQYARADRQRRGADRLRADPARLHDDPLADRAAAPASARSIRATSSTPRDNTPIVVITQLQPISVSSPSPPRSVAQGKLTLGTDAHPGHRARRGRQDRARSTARSIWSTTRSIRPPARSS